VAQQYPETEKFYRWFMEQLEPLCLTQDWYRPWQTAGESV